MKRNKPEILVGFIVDFTSIDDQALIKPAIVKKFAKLIETNCINIKGAKITKIKQFTDVIAIEHLGGVIELNVK